MEPCSCCRRPRTLLAEAAARTTAAAITKTCRGARRRTVRLRAPTASCRRCYAAATTNHAPGASGGRTPAKANVLFAEGGEANTDAEADQGAALSPPQKGSPGRTRTPRRGGGGPPRTTCRGGRSKGPGSPSRTKCRAFSRGDHRASHRLRAFARSPRHRCSRRGHRRGCGGRGQVEARRKSCSSVWRRAV